MLANIALPLMISMYGDSTMLGYEYVNGQVVITKYNPPYDLQQLYGNRATVNSAARIGATIKDLIEGTGWFKKPFAESIKDDNGHYIIENFGINDAYTYDAETYEAYLNKFIDIVSDNQKIPILEEPNPICATWSKQLENFVGVIDKVAAYRHVTIIQQYNYIINMGAWQLLLGDCIHPNDFLYSLKAQKEYDTLNSMLEIKP